MRRVKTTRNFSKLHQGKGPVEKIFVLVFMIRNTASLSSSVVYNPLHTPYFTNLRVVKLVKDGIITEVEVCKIHCCLPWGKSYSNKPWVIRSNAVNCWCFSVVDHRTTSYCYETI